MREKDEALLLPESSGDNRNFDIGGHLWNQYWWVLLIAASLMLLWVVPMSTSSGTIESAEIEKTWNDDEDPIIIGHLTDVHINSLEPQRNHKFKTVLKNYRKFNLDTLIITGDLVDNWGDRRFGQYGQQFEPDYQLYRKLSTEYHQAVKNVIELAGNHDVFGLSQYESPNNNFLKYTKTHTRHPDQKLEEFWATPIETDEVVVLALNPFRFPAPHAKFDFWVRQTAEILDFLERSLARANEMAKRSTGRSKPVIVACHYPMTFWVMTNVRSSSGSTFEEIIERSGASLYISGHAHPTHSHYRHHNGFLEVCAQDLNEHDGYSIITIDNGRPYHRTYNVSETPNVILTHPVPAKMLTKNVPFSEKTTAIRLISMNDSLNIEVRGVVDGKMKCVRQLKNGAYLYSYPLKNLERGFHTLEFDGDWKYELDFFVGTQMNSFEEDYYIPVNQIVFALALLAIAVLVNCLFLRPCRSIHVDVNDRIRLLPTWLRYLLTFSVIAPLVLPIAFVNIEGEIGFTCLYGYYADFGFVYDVWGQIIVMVYELGVVLSSVLFAATMVNCVPWHSVFLFDIVISFAMLIGSLKYVSKGLIESSGHVLAALSPLFVFMPIILYSAIIIWRVGDRSVFFRCGRADEEKSSKAKVD